MMLCNPKRPHEYDKRNLKLLPLGFEIHLNSKESIRLFVFAAIITQKLEVDVVILSFNTGAEFICWNNANCSLLFLKFKTVLLAHEMNFQ